MVTIPTQYNMSFTSSSLLLHESLLLAKLYMELGDWIEVRQAVLVDNLLQARTLITLRKISAELISRLKLLSHEEMSYLLVAQRQEQGYLLWIATCRRYRFIADFAVDVLHERFISRKTDLNLVDFDVYLNRKAEWHPEIDKLTTATKSKLRQVLFRMLRESDLLTANNIISSALVSPKFESLLLKLNPHELHCLPFYESDCYARRIQPSNLASHNVGSNDLK